MNQLDTKALTRHRKRFLRFFPGGFYDPLYLAWEHDYKWEAHKLFEELLNKREFERLLKEKEFLEIAKRALKVETRTTFLFSFEKMALRDAVNTVNGATMFAEGLYSLLYEKGSWKNRFPAWIMTVSELPRKKSRVCSWPVVTLFPYLAQPKKYMILKPTAMRKAAFELGFDLDYSSKPSSNTYESLMEFADLTRDAISNLKPRNYHDIQTFLWIIGSAEYERIEEEMKDISS